MFCVGRGVSVRSAWSSYSMNTRLPNSRKRSQRVHPGRQSGSPQPVSTPPSQYISESGPHGPGPPTPQKFSEEGSGTIRSAGMPIFSQRSIATSSGPSFSSGSPACTVAQQRSQSSFRCSRMNSVACSIAPSLKYCPNEKLPSISKNVRWYVSRPTSSMSGVRKHFCTVVVSGAGGGSRPRKYGICGCMPALVSSVERSSARGISDADGQRRCPFDSKNERKPSRISADVRTSPILGVSPCSLGRRLRDGEHGVTALTGTGSPRAEEGGTCTPAPRGGRAPTQGRRTSRARSHVEDLREDPPL